MKLKHNKLRNPSILFEILIRQITEDTLNNRDSKAVGIIKKHFNNTEIAKEYRIYKSLSETKGLSESKANSIISIAMESHKRINKSLLKSQKYKLVSDIMENYNIDDLFKTKLDNYKTLASIYLLFEMNDSGVVAPELESKYRFTIMESICQSKPSEAVDPLLEEYSNMDKGTKALVYKVMVQNFNEKYSDLDDKQKVLLKKYVNNVTTSDKFRSFLNEELVSVKASINDMLPKVGDAAKKVKIEEVLSFANPVPDNKKVCDNDVQNLLYYYELHKELVNELS